MVGGAHHDGFSDFVANEHIDHTSVTFTAGTGLTGGGDISSNRTFAVDGLLEDLDTLGANSADSEFLVGTGAGALAWETTTTVRTSLGLGTGDTPTFTTLDLSQNITLVTTTSSTTGVVTKAAIRFLHNFQPSGGNSNSNTFLGLYAGNFTMTSTGTTGINNTGIGYNTLAALTTGYGNTAIGALTLDALTTGYSNVGIGEGALGILTTGYSNLAVGYLACTNVTTTQENIGIGAYAISNGLQNVGIGYRTGAALDATGAGNVFIGYQCGDASTTGNYNIVIGYNLDTPAATDDNKLNIGATIFGALDTHKVGIGVIPVTALTVEGALTLKEQAAADADTAAYGQIWIKTATPNVLMFTDDAGNDTQITTVGGSAGFSSKVNGWLDADQVIANVTWTVVLFDTENYDTDSEFDITTNKGRFTAAVTGYYHVNARTTFKNIPDRCITSLRAVKNAAQTPYFEHRTYTSYTADAAATNISTGDIYLEAGDYLEFQCYHNSGVNDNLDGREKSSHVQIHRFA